MGRVVAVVLLFLLVGTSAANAAHSPFARGGFDGYSGATLVPPGVHGVLTNRVAPPVGPFPRIFKTVPLWKSTFQYGGQRYGSVMVGTDPAAGSVTTTVPVTIVPLRLTFARDGSVLDYPGMATELAQSSLFTPVPFITGTTQLGDAIRRGDFWHQVSSTSLGYHTLLGSPTIVPTQSWTVPAASGLTYYGAAANRTFGIVEEGWYGQQVKKAIAALNIDPRSLVIFLAYNTYGSDGTPDSCFTSSCFLFAGVHGALINPPNSVNTFVYADFEDFGDEVPAGLNVHFLATSHEVLEWLNDPIVINSPSDPFSAAWFDSSVPAWTSPYYPNGCSSDYEVADPLESGAPSIGVPDSGNIDLFADAVFQPWFARTPSTSINGLYDAIGSLPSYSAPC
jgi:hypothetical protein